MGKKAYTLCVTVKDRETGEVNQYKNVHDIAHYYGSDRNGFSSYLRLYSNEINKSDVRIYIPLDKCDVEITKGEDREEDAVIVGNGLHRKGTVVPKLVKLNKYEYIRRCSGCNAVWLNSTGNNCRGCGKEIDWTGEYISEGQEEE